MKRLLPTVVLLVASCVTVSKSVLDPSFQSAPVPKEEVDVLLASFGDEIPGDCTRVAILHASGPEDWTEEGDMIEKLRDEAGKLGANTVFVQNMVDPGTGERIVSALLDEEPDRDSDALALYCPPGG
jgi:hypothetical protein